MGWPTINRGRSETAQYQSPPDSFSNSVTKSEFSSRQLIVLQANVLKAAESQSRDDNREGRGGTRAGDDPPLVAAANDADWRALRNCSGWAPT
jgi:hypothetical protein